MLEAPIGDRERHGRRDRVPRDFPRGADGGPLVGERREGVERGERAGERPHGLERESIDDRVPPDARVASRRLRRDRSDADDREGGRQQPRAGRAAH